MKFTFQQAVEKAIQQHNNFYEYIEDSWKGYQNQIDIICPQHEAETTVVEAGIDNVI